MLTINYIIRNTAAKTEYTEMAPEDMETVKAILLKCSAMICEASNAKSEEGKDAFKDFIKKTEKLPRGRDNMNSVASFTGGLVNNLVFGEQRDFTTRQLIAIEYITMVMHSHTDEIPLVRFRLGLIR